MLFLYAGAAGLIVPHCNTVADVEHVLPHAFFPPLGIRSFAPFSVIRGLNDTRSEDEPSLTDYCNKRVVLFPQIESPEAVENIEAMAQIKEVRGFFIGYGDLRATHNLSLALDGPEPVFNEALERIRQVGEKYDLPIGGVAGGHPGVTSMAKKRLNQGLNLMVVTMDTATLAYGMQMEVMKARTETDEWVQEKQKSRSNGDIQSVGKTTTS